jgi:hypothetical protein
MQYGFTAMVSLSLAGVAVAAVRDVLQKPLAVAAANL